MKVNHTWYAQMIRDWETRHMISSYQNKIEKLVTKLIYLSLIPPLLEPPDVLHSITCYLL